MIISESNLRKLLQGKLNEAGYVPEFNIEYWDHYDKEIIGGIDGWPSKSTDMKVGKCTQSACAQWVSDIFGPNIRIGNAWHAHNAYKASMIYTSFKNISKDNQRKMAKLFTILNKAAAKTDKSKFDKGSYERKAAKVYIQGMNLIPDQSQFDNLNLGDIVGIYLPESTYNAKCFFEGATGYNNLGKDGKALGGNHKYFVTKKGRKPWKPSMLGEDIEFVPGPQLINGDCFGMNSHVGVVGAKHDGVPIIYHNMSNKRDAWFSNLPGNVYATGLDAIKSGSSRKKTKIVWAAKNPASK
jgi:hypothetical protein